MSVLTLIVGFFAAIGAFAASPASAQTNPAPPKVTTGAAESLSRTGATLTGAITPGLVETTYRFEYGTTTSYGLSTPVQTLPASDAAAPVTAAITGLTANTTYNFRLIATNAAGSTQGINRTLKTPANAAAPAVSTQAATDLAGQSATLVAKVNPRGQDTQFYFEYGTSTKYGTKTALTPAGAGTASVTVRTPITGLKPTQKYNYRVVAVNPTGTTRGGNRAFTTTRGLVGVSAEAASSKVVWNAGGIVRGTVAGLKTGSVKVALLRQDFPFTDSFRQVATQSTSSAGAYSFDTGPLYAATKFQVVTVTKPALSSPALTIKNWLLTKLRVSTKRSKTMTLSGRVFPVIPQGTTSVQRRTPKGRWIRVKRAVLSHDTVKNRSTYRVSVPRISRTARYRVIVTPRDAKAHLITTTQTVTVAKRR